ncbi:PREDICTED: thioredoxin-related transmembrane protein 2 homolog [Rhagoletis zephyria]|uniref:thioredoxin-related transmembrane protein 2 homolog n=1 Tax=Rhagoletis zephyria TaxID=28612 RepID=UPI0008113921|nr:PREDICTED: thioredoxin-related transmembrane protein 2 homolog [Rhagoletis zephyria]
MVLIEKRELRKVLHPHYLTNIILALSFILLKSISPICAVTFIPYLSSACMITKLGNVILFAASDPVYCVIYIALCVLQLLLLPEPTYSGPEAIAYYKGADLDEEIARDKRVTWLVELYTVWSPPCIDFSSVFAELSNKYSLPNLKFAKVDLARNTDTATKYKINTSTLSKQLPTLILFENGQESMRRPIVNHQGKLVKFTLSYDTVVSEFDLNNVYEECKKNPIKDKKEKKEKTT